MIDHVLRPGGQGGGAATAPPDGSDDPGLFPPVLAAGSVMGVVTGEGGAAYGLPVGVPVTIAGHDHLAAAAGLGGGPDDLFNSVGTAETLVRRLDTAPDVDRALELDLAVTVWPGGDAWGVLASATRSGLVIDALTAHLGTEPAALDRLAAAGPPAAAPSGGPMVDGPMVDGPMVDGPMVDLGQGIEVPAGPPGAMWTATLQALTRRTAAAAERVTALAGPAPPSGGLRRREPQPGVAPGQGRRDGVPRRDQPGRRGHRPRRSPRRRGRGRLVSPLSGGLGQHVAKGKRKPSPIAAVAIGDPTAATAHGGRPAERR